MTTGNERVPPPTEVSPPETGPSSGSTFGPVQPGPDNDAHLAIGYLLGGRYRVERELGEGGMGVVYLARDEQIAGEVFAIKVLNEDLHPETLALLREEVRKTRKLSHPNIVDVHSVNLDSKRLYVLMEYLEGKPLDALLNEEFGRGMPFSHAWPIIEDVAAALGNAHDHNIIHSDLKPANVFVTTSGRTKLLDFGIARVSRGPLLHAQAGPRALTPAYASCEMLEGREADRRDDIYSFACVIYEMLSGERPYSGLSALAARERGARVQPLGVLTHGQNSALAQALAFDREARTSSVEHLIGALAAVQQPHRRPLAILGAASVAALVAASLIYLVLDKFLAARHSAIVETVATNAQPAAPTPGFNPPPHSIAVLPFVNMSGDKEQEYFSDGLAEELLNDLSRVNELQVAARTSAFAFKGKDVKIDVIARELDVGAILEGSVRRSGPHVRITAQLINGATGFHMWSETYDRDFGDVLKLESEIATAVVNALKVTLLAGGLARVELGGTHDPAAFDAYLRGVKSATTQRNAKDLQTAIDTYAEAIRLDADYALAYARRSKAQAAYANDYASSPEDRRRRFDDAYADAQRAIALAPELAEGHLALAGVFDTGTLDFARASGEYERALALAPGDARVLRDTSRFAARMGRPDVSVPAAQRVVTLDPLNRFTYESLGLVLWFARQYDEAIGAFRHSQALDPDFPGASALLGLTYYTVGQYDSARETCETRPDDAEAQECLALTYERLRRHADAEAMLAKLKAAAGDDSAYQYAEIYAQWGNLDQALRWLETARRLRDPGLVELRVNPLFDPLRQEPRFQAIERDLKFPE